MTPTEKGAFCPNCKKEVFDFTNTSNYNLAKSLDSEKKMCGKFRPGQLNKNIPSSGNKKYTKAGLLIGVSTLISLSTPVFGQDEPSGTLKTEQSELARNTHDISEKPTDSIQIRGNVSDGNGGLPGANIMLKNHSYSVRTDFDGNFSIGIGGKEVKQDLTLLISYLGFETQEIKINEKTEFIKVEMIEDEVLMGEVAIIKKQHIFRRIGNLFRKRNKKACH